MIAYFLVEAVTFAAESRKQERKNRKGTAMISKMLLMLAAAGPLVMFAPTQARADHGGDRDRDGRRGIDLRADFDFGRRAGVIVDARQTVPAGYRWVQVQVQVTPGYYRTEEIPAQYGVRYDIHGRAFTVLVAPAVCRQVWVEATYRRQLVRVVDDGCALVIVTERRAGIQFDLRFGLHR